MHVPLDVQTVGFEGSFPAQLNSKHLSPLYPSKHVQLSRRVHVPFPLQIEGESYWNS